MILIDGSAFLYPMGRMFENGQDAAKVLRPLKFYMMDENNKNMQSVAKYEYSLLPFDPKSGIEVTIGRAIAKDELELIRAEYNITDDDMSDTFVDTKGSVYGKKYMKEYTCVQIRVSAEQARELEEKLMDKGIEAGNIAPGRVNIRVE